MTDHHTNNVYSGLRKRFPYFSPFTSQIWLNKSTDHTCNVLMTFPENTSDDVIIWFLENLIRLEPDIRISIKYHSTTGVYGFYITFTYERLLKGAARLRLEKPIKQEFGGGFKAFLFEDLEFYENVDNEETFFNTQEYQLIISQLLFAIRVDKNDTIQGITIKIDDPLVQFGLEKKLIEQVIPLHNKEKLIEFVKTWVCISNMFKPQPIEQVRQYFGVKIALYFCWLSFYTKALCFPAVYGTYIWYYTGQSQELDDKLFIINSILNIIWATGFLVFWRRRQAEIAYEWNTLDMEQLEEIRPAYKGVLYESPITNKYEPYYPPWKRLLFRLCVTLPLLFINLVLVSISIVLIVRFQIWINENIKPIHAISLLSLIRFLPKILLALLTTVFHDIYNDVCHWLTEKENYREQQDFDNHIIAKMFCCACVNSYLSVFYIAFFQHHNVRLADQFITIFVIKQFWDHIKEAAIPYMVLNTRLAMLLRLSKKEKSLHFEQKALEDRFERLINQLNDTFNENNLDIRSVFHSVSSLRTAIANVETSTLSQAEMECVQPKWPDLYEDYLEIVIQFGFIIFLSTLFPLAALFCLISNMLEIRADAFKLCLILQRPFSQRVKDIGHWEEIMEYMIVAAIIVNCIFCSIRGVFSRMLPGLPFAAEIFLLVCIEHLLIAMCIFIRSFMHNVPHWVRVEKAKVEYRRFEALSKLEHGYLHSKEKQCSRI